MDNLTEGIDYIQVDENGNPIEIEIDPFYEIGKIAKIIGETFKILIGAMWEGI